MENYTIKFSVKTRADCDRLLQRLRRELGAESSLLVSRSNTSYHVWVFLAQRLSFEERHFFGVFVARDANVEAEIYPDALESPSLDLTEHRFVPTGDLDNTERLDTPAIIEAVHNGLYRTPTELVIAYMANYRRRLLNTALQPDPQEVICAPKSPWTRVFGAEDAGYKVLELFGKKVQTKKLGQAFICPVHPERRPSASFVRDSNGLVVFHDWHSQKYGRH